MMDNKWWHNAVIYQIYPRSFQDSNDDGIGDLQGIISRLDYLHELGIDAIWLSPVCKSPQDDNGYDISDYQDIDPIFGTLNDMRDLISEGKKRNIRIILDLVLNHCSDEHPWFIKAKKNRDNPYHDYYIWRNGTEGSLPNDMKAIFGGSMWEFVPGLGQYYFHQFSVKQPDLNWENPKLRQEIYVMINWWIELGVGGFRLDVIDQIAKEPDCYITANGPRLHEYLREMNTNCFHNKDLVTVGEAWGSTTDIAKLSSNPDGSELSMVFQFEHILLDSIPGKAKWDLAPLPLQKLKEVTFKWQKELYGEGWNSLFWCNHDLPRIVSRWGSDTEYRIESAKMLATLLHGMQGTPYIYQGEELGMTNIAFQSISDYRDIETINMHSERLEAGYHESDIMNSIYARGRDNARTPMQWDDSDNAGFSSSEPWIKVNPNYRDINACQQLMDDNSVFHHYKKLITLRKQYPIFVLGEYEPILLEYNDIFAYTRKYENQRLVVICNFYEKHMYLSLDMLIHNKSKLLLSNYSKTTDVILGLLKFRPYEAVIFLDCIE